MKPRNLMVGISLAVALLAIAIGVWLHVMSTPTSTPPKGSAIGRLWARILETYQSITGGPDWGTWVAHASIGALCGYFGQPACASVFYGLRELEQVVTMNDGKWLDHVMDWVAPTAAAFAMARWA